VSNIGLKQGQTSYPRCFVKEDLKLSFSDDIDYYKIILYDLSINIG
jgi:hypothetical protein